MPVMAKTMATATAFRRGGRIHSGTAVVLGMFLGGIALGLIALKFRRFQPLPGPMTTQPTSQPATRQAETQPDSAPAGQRRADLPDQR
jgi:hypothetical protein